MTLSVGLVAIGLVSCKSGDSPKGSRAKAEGEAVQNLERIAGAHQAVARPTSNVGMKQAAAQRQEPAPNARGVPWASNVAWHSYTEGVELAREESKPMLVVVYADWCPKCRALGPLFGEPDIAELASRFVMVRQDHDENPAWLKPYNEKYGGYVPRIFFFDSEGNLRDEVTSGHPRYPYFYAAQSRDFLKRSMRRAIGS